MTGRIAKTRQEPLGPDETFSMLVTRLISTNRAEKASRDRASQAGPTLPRARQTDPDPPERLTA